MPVKEYAPVVATTLLPNVGGWLGSYITRKNLNPWYESLKKPTWTPPKWAFGPAWTSIYCSVGYASYLVWQDGNGFERAALPLSIYGCNLALNWSWTPLFFGAHKIRWALYEITVLWGTTAAMGVAFYRVNPLAGYLVIPYLVWNSLAVALNYVIDRDNEESTQPAIEEKKD